jgi:hydrogenase expression/formation protein HypD
VTLARQQPDRQVVFFAVGFETTAPATAAAVLQARHFGLRNFSVLVAHVRVPPAMELLLSGSECRIQGFLAAGHVCAVMGCAEYEVISRRRRVPIVVTGFEPVDLLEGILLCVRQLEAGRAEVENAYARSVRAGGNSAACALVDKVFEVVPMAWRGLGEIPESGLGLRSEFAAFDAELRFRPEVRMAGEPPECRSGLVLQGLIKPEECPAFGGLCTPERPLGAPMVSSEGACAAYYRYRGAPAAEG